MIPLAPLHNKAHLVGYNAFKKVLPSVPQIAVFDTAFHQSMDAEDYTFPIPYEYTEKYQIRRYGAHGTSHKYLSQEGKKYLENPENDTGKELIVFRDSFASSLIPLLVEGYDKITLVDTRYISPKILNKYIEFNNQDILFLYSTSIINNSYSLK